IHYAGCCNPIPGDLITGVINTGTGVTIHNQTCHNLRNLALNPQRMLDVCWKENNDETQFFPSRIRVIMQNKSGSLADVSSIIARKKVNIINIKIINRNIDYFELMIDIEVNNTEHLEDIISALRISKKIVDVERIMI
ncbi:MAG TPA: ACT domain-containing protein, partial [Rickettsiales bacterium]|nr:ACT domain-containing protein [Rickettsiales bacterium]